MVIEMAWEYFKKDNRISARSCASSGDNTYQKRYERFMLESWSDRFPRWENYDDCKCGFHCINDRLSDDGDFFKWLLKTFGKITLFNSRQMPEALQNLNPNESSKIRQ